MADFDLRDLERAANAGDLEAACKLSRYRRRSGICPICEEFICKCPQPVLFISDQHIVANLLDPNGNEIEASFSNRNFTPVSLAAGGHIDLSLILPRGGHYTVAFSATTQRRPECFRVSLTLLFNGTVRHCTEYPDPSDNQILNEMTQLEIPSMGSLLCRISAVEEPLDP